ncbi:hypothetical protein KDI_28830 [Dictyobacter arantiisoli]|uniref:Uncharacterized protein n=1 Tax=Dictyobacter arantiisoli TaxID=2014874 RepID=A0A5A5TE82_9CHLR|nr:hypothetical protein KDI_28830 [Dictyobacter arantiisoli]
MKKSFHSRNIGQKNRARTEFNLFRKNCLKKRLTEKPVSDIILLAPDGMSEALL